jgi:NADH-quinone oxidoreductase subunit A
MMPATLEPYAAIGFVLLVVMAIAASMLVLAHTIGPRRRHGIVKDTPYESGMPPIADTQRRFNVRFYIVAVLFLLFDVEVVFLWPWAQAYVAAARHGVTIPLETGGVADKSFLLVGMALFFALLVFGLVYEWKKGAFEWD